MLPIYILIICLFFWGQFSVVLKKKEEKTPKLLVELAGDISDRLPRPGELFGDRCYVFHPSINALRLHWPFCVRHLGCQAGCVAVHLT